MVVDPLPAAASTPASAISWPAVWAGASVAVASSLTLTLVASGLGYAVSYPGLASRGSLAGFSPVVGATAVTIQVLSGALGGYVAGRLRTTWLGVHDDEAHFRDTAHGLIAWAVATVAGVLIAALVLAPYAEQLTVHDAAAATTTAHAAEIAAQSSLFLGLGLLLSAFVSAVAARLGGLQHEAMHLRGRAV